MLLKEIRIATTKEVISFIFLIKLVSIIWKVPKLKEIYRNTKKKKKELLHLGFTIDLTLRLVSCL